MIDIPDKKNKILQFLETNGPSLPVRIARVIEMDPVFASAIISELMETKKIKTSYMKIGASPLYFLPGQEQKLEEHSDNLKSIEKEILLKLEKNKILFDEKEEPAGRVALRNIKDFAIPFEFNEKIIWRYSFEPYEEIEKLLSKKEEPKDIQESAEKKETYEEEVPKAWKVKKEEIEEIKSLSNQKDKKENVPTEDNAKDIENIFIQREETNEAIKEEPEFLAEIKEFLKKKDIEFLEEIRTEKKEIMATISVPSHLENITFLLIAKNKKTVTKDEIQASIQIATKNKMPCLLIIRRHPQKSIQKFLEENNLIKLQIIEKK